MLYVCGGGDFFFVFEEFVLFVFEFVVVIGKVLFVGFVFDVSYFFEDFWIFGIEDIDEVYDVFNFVLVVNFNMIYVVCSGNFVCFVEK